MSPRAYSGRRHLHVIFGLFLASGVTVGAYFLWAVADWIRPQTVEPGVYAIGMTVLAARWFWWRRGGP